MIFDAFGRGGVSEMITVQLLGVDLIHFNTRQRRTNIQEILIDIGSFHMNSGSGEVVKNTNSRPRVQLRAGLIIC
jgi:hypothetical protein